MESSPPDFLWSYPQTPPRHSHSPPFHSLLPSPISAPLQPQSSPIGLCSSPGPLPSSGGTSQLLITLPQVPRVPFQWHSGPHHKWGSWLGCWCWCGVHTTAWVWYTCHKQGSSYEEKKLLKIIISIRIKYSPWGVHQAILPGTHTSLAEVSTPILTAAPLRYFSSCFPLVFLEGHCSSSSPAVTSLCLDPMTWDPSAPSNRAASSFSNSSQSRWRYSIVLFFFFSSSATLFLGFGLRFSPGFLSCMLCMMGFCCLLQLKEGLLLLLMPLLHLMALLLEHLSVILWNVGRGRGRHNDMETAKNFLFCLCIVDLGTITGFLDKPNRTLKAQS